VAAIMRYRLIPTRSEDEAWLEKLSRAAYRDLFVATWGGWDEDRHQRHFAACLECGEICAIEIDDARVGMVQLFEHTDAIEIGEIQIEPEYQGRGIGTQVLRDTLAQAHAQRKKVILRTGLKNIRAIELYRRLGFERVIQTETHEHMECKPKPDGTEIDQVT
jgi:ribosomal protein S18 acetylase RimI-like enzyme